MCKLDQKINYKNLQLIILLYLISVTFSSILKSASIFCMIMIISVYIYLPKFRTVYSNCCLCYFICLTISFILIWYENIFRDRLEDKSCYLVGNANAISFRLITLFNMYILFQATAAISQLWPCSSGWQSLTSIYGERL